MRFRIDLKIILLLVIFYMTKQIQIYAVIMLFAILHELGHLLAGILLGMKVEKMELIPMGLSVSFKLSPEDYNKKIGKGNQLTIKKILVALAGPITNIAITLIMMGMEFSMGIKLLIIYSNILIALFNLLPIYPLDGGRIVKGILHLILGRQGANRYINDISMITAICLTAIASIAVVYFKNIAIVLIILYLWYLVLKENKKYKQQERIYQMIKKNR